MTGFDFIPSSADNYDVFPLFTLVSAQTGHDEWSGYIGGQNLENRNEVKIGEGTFIVERSFTPGESVKDLLVQRLISEKKKDDLNEIA